MYSFCNLRLKVDSASLNTIFLKSNVNLNCYPKTNLNAKINPITNRNRNLTQTICRV